MSAIHMFFPMTSSGDLDDGNPIPTSTDFGCVVNHKPRPFTLGCISSALLDLLPCACVSAPHTDTQYGLGDGSPIIHDPTSILPLPPRRSTPPSYMSQAMPIPTTIDHQHLPVTACCVLEPSRLGSASVSRPSSAICPACCASPPPSVSPAVPIPTTVNYHHQWKDCNVLGSGLGSASILSCSALTSCPTSYPGRPPCD